MHHLKEQLNENGITRNEFDLMAIDRLSKKDQAINYLNYHLMYASVEDRLKMAHILIKDAKVCTVNNELVYTPIRRHYSAIFRS